MKTSFVLAIILVLAVASAAKSFPIKCTLNPLTVRCTREFKEVCGITLKDGKQIRNNYSNACMGCAIGRVDFYLPHSCDLYPENAIFCTPEQKLAEMCTMEYTETCGWYGENVQCIQAPCAMEASNKCVACADENVVYYTAGSCPKKIGI